MWLRVLHTCFLLFTDDAILFFRTTNQECQVVKNILTQYGEASGQEVNFAKSSIIYSANMSTNARMAAGQIFNVPEQEGPCKYLGMPLLFGRKKLAFLVGRRNLPLSLLKVSYRIDS